MNKVLDLVAAIEDDNHRYTTNVRVAETDKIDYYINCRRYLEIGGRFSGSTSFDHDKLNELRDEFSEVSVSSYVTKGGPAGVDGADDKPIYRHEVEIQVIE